MNKELFIAAWERIYADALDEGLSESQAAKRADDMAYDGMRDTLADMADSLGDC